MRSNTMVAAIVTTLVWLAGSTAAQAQWEDPEGGFTSPPPAAPAGPAASTGGGGGDDGSSIRLVLQGRWSAFNSFVGPLGDVRIMPVATPGIRLIDNKLFIGLGIGFDSVSDGGPTIWNLTPMGSFDILSNDYAALSALLTLSFGSLELPGTVDSFLIGMNLGLGIRGKITEALAIGTEWGWGFLAFTDADSMIGESSFVNGFFGVILLEASIGL